jgi:hypothetical protein
MSPSRIDIASETKQLLAHARAGSASPLTKQDEAVGMNETLMQEELMMDSKITVNEDKFTQRLEQIGFMRNFIQELNAPAEKKHQRILSKGGIVKDKRSIKQEIKQYQGAIADLKNVLGNINFADNPDPNDPLKDFQLIEQQMN